MENLKVIKSNLLGDAMQRRVEAIMGENSPSFLNACLHIVATSNTGLANCSPASIQGAVLAAASLRMPAGMGYWYIVPYGNDAQFQIGAYGLVQLAHRTKEYKFLNAIPVYQNQFEGFDYMEEKLYGNFTIEGEGEIVGYAAGMKLNYGFEKTIFWTAAKMEAHARQYSKQYGKSGMGIWKTEKPKMGRKTVLKALLGKWAPLSNELVQAFNIDQTVIMDGKAPQYVDRQIAPADVNAQADAAEAKRLLAFIESATAEQLNAIDQELLSVHGLLSAFDDRLLTIQTAAQ